MKVLLNGFDVQNPPETVISRVQTCGNDWSREDRSCIYNTRTGCRCQLIVIKLREAIAAYEERTGETLTYAELAAQTGLARATVESLGSRTTYSTTLKTIDKLCETLGCDLHDLLEYRPSKKRR